MIITAKKAVKSPLRYPGGKGCFYPYFIELIKQNGLNITRYFEPFAGGAGVALGLLSSNIVTEVKLNDADYHIYCFWLSVLKENERFIDKIYNIKLSIKEWRNQKEIYQKPENFSVFDVGFSTFYLNRSNRSGILMGAGPIGGYKQNGKWRLGARFNKNYLITIISNIAQIKNYISIDNMDALHFLKKYLPRANACKNVFVYIDPPYVSAGNRLYLNIYSDEDHRKLADYLLKHSNLKWVATYDDVLLIRKLYVPCQRWLFNLNYSLQSKQKGKELLIAPEWLTLPNKKNFISNKWSITKKIALTRREKNGIAC